MKEQARFPLRFFTATFIWSWIFWLPMVFFSQGIIHLSPGLLSGLIMPVVIVGAFGPLAGALYALRVEQGKGPGAKYLKSFLDLRLGWKAWVFPFLILGGTAAIAWILPEFWGSGRLPRLIPSWWMFIPYLLLMMFFGGGQEEFGWRGYALPVSKNGPGSGWATSSWQSSGRAGISRYGL